MGGSHILGAHGGVPVDPGSSWTAFVLVSLLAVTTILYWRGWYRTRRHVPDIRSLWRPCCFLGGVLALWVVLGSPLARLHHGYLLGHMLQHLVLSLGAAPLILLGSPEILLRQGLPWPFLRHCLQRVVKSASVRLVRRILDKPAVCWGVSTLVVVGWHLPMPFELTGRSDGWHLLECATFFASGLLFWRPVIEPWPSASTLPQWSKPLYLFGATLPCDVLAAFLAFSDRVLYPAYQSMPRPAQMTALQDQAAAGALMWFCVTFAYGVPASAIVLAWLMPRHAPRPLATTMKVSA